MLNFVAGVGVILAGIGGVGKDLIVVVGNGIDSVRLTMMLRKMGSAELVNVTPSDKKEYKESKGKIVQVLPNCIAASSPYKYSYQIHDASPSCAIISG